MRPPAPSYPPACPPPMMTHPLLRLSRAALICAPLAVALLTPAAPAAEAPATGTGSAALAVERAHHLALLGADRWHAAGARGRGLKVAVLDGGFRGYKTFLGTALPATVTVHTFRKDGNFEGKNTQHGIMCAEVVHALAPD